jgi:hypothetical protein
MAFIPVDRTINAFLQYSGPDGELMGTSLDFRTGSAVTIADLNDLGAGIASWWDTDMQPLMTAGYTLERIKLRDLTAEDSFIVDWVGILPLTGSLAGNSLPSSVAWCIKKQTGFAGRSFRGRIYHMGMGEAEVSGNYVDATYASNVLDAWENLMSQLDETGNGFQMVVVSRYTNGAPRLAGVATNVTGLVHVDLRVDTQRRRLPRD